MSYLIMILRISILVLIYQSAQRPNPSGLLRNILLGATSFFPLLFPQRHPKTELIFVLTLWLAIAGSLLHLFSPPTHFDEFMHLALPFSITFFLVSIIKNKQLVFSLTLAIAILWEFYEWLSDVWLFPSDMILTKSDTSLDLIFAVLGSLLALKVSRRLLQPSHRNH